MDSNSIGARSTVRAALAPIYLLFLSLKHCHTHGASLFNIFVFDAGGLVPAAFEFPAMELKLVNLSMPGLLSTSMVVMAHPSIGGGWKTLGTLVVLTCVAYILMCTAVLYYMEKYKPVRFAYDQSFPTGRGTKTNYREASMYEKVRAIVLFQSVKIGSWQLSTGENLHWSRSGVTSRCPSG